MVSFFWNAPEVLQGGVLLLEREAHGVAVSEDLNFRGLDFYGLAAAHGGHQLALDGQGGTCSDAFKELFREELRIGDNLDIIDSGPVVQGDEFHLFVASLGTYPAFCQYFPARLRGEQSLDFGPFHSFHNFRYFKSCKYNISSPIRQPFRGRSARYSCL